MRWIRERHYAKDWCPWFAWFPVRVGILDGDGIVWTWWETVYRRKNCMLTSQGVQCWYDYRLPEQARAEGCA